MESKTNEPNFRPLKLSVIYKQRINNFNGHGMDILLTYTEINTLLITMVLRLFMNIFNVNPMLINSDNSYFQMINGNFTNTINRPTTNTYFNLNKLYIIVD